MAGAVAEWSWTHITPEGFSEAQARRGRLGAAALSRRRAQQMRGEGASYREIADELGVGIGSVSALLRPPVPAEAKSA